MFIYGHIYCKTLRDTAAQEILVEQMKSFSCNGFWKVFGQNWSDFDQNWAKMYQITCRLETEAS